MPPLHVLVKVIDAPNQNPEEVEVDDLGGGRYRVLCPPRFAYGLAADDEFELRDGFPHVTRHSGNLTIWFFCATDADARQLAAKHGAALAAAGAKVEGTAPRMVIVTVPHTAGWQNIERAMNAAAQATSGTTWQYGNVYDARDGITPLNWWLKPQP